MLVLAWSLLRLRIMRSPTVAVTLLITTLGCTNKAQNNHDAAVAPDGLVDASAPDARPDASPPDASPPDASLSPQAIDVLFVIDNSLSMAEEQQTLIENFPKMIEALTPADGIVPDLHIGVVSTDVGVGMHGARHCDATGDEGRLQNRRRRVDCNAPSDPFIKDYAGTRRERLTNYEGADLSATFACIAELGTDGCGFEQPLESMRRALDGTLPITAFSALMRD